MLLTVPAIRDALPGDDLSSTIRYLEAVSHEMRLNAVREQGDNELHISLDDRLLWSSTADMMPEKKKEMQKQAFHLPSRVEIVDVQYMDGSKQSSGESTIIFHKQNYADPATIHLRQESRYISLMIEPFLKTIRVREDYIDFEILAGNEAVLFSK